MNPASIFRFLASMPFGLGLFVTVAAVSAAGSVFPAWGPGIYRSWWFVGLLLVLIMNTGLCAARQIRGLKKRGWRFRLIWMIHVSVLVVAAACVWAAMNFRITTVTVAVGQSFAVGTETWSLEKVEVNYYPEGGVSDWISHVKTPAGRFPIRVNKPISTGSTKVLQSGYQKTYQLAAAQGDHIQEVILDQDVEAPLTENGEIGFVLTPPREGLISQAQASGELPETVDLLLTSRGRILQRTAVFVGVPLDLGDTGLRLTVLRSEAKSTFLIRDTPALPVVWVGFALLALSTSVLVFFPRQKKYKEISHA